MIFRSDLINCIFLLIYHISLFMNSRRMLANSRSFAQNSRSFQGKKAHFRIQGVFQDKTQIQGVFKACANHDLNVKYCTLEKIILEMIIN